MTTKVTEYRRKRNVVAQLTSRHWQLTVKLTDETLIPISRVHVCERIHVEITYFTCDI